MNTVIYASNPCNSEVENSSITNPEPLTQRQQELQAAIDWLEDKPPAPPVLWKNGKFIPIEEIQALAKYPHAKLIRLAETVEINGDPRDVYHFKVEIICRECQIPRVYVLNKKELSDLLKQGRGNQLHEMICRPCSERLKEERDQEEAEDKCDNVENFIGFIINPDEEWDEDRSRWFKELLSDLSGLDHGLIKHHIKQMDYGEFLQTPYWKAVAQQVRHRSRYRCQVCNSAEFLQVHHRDYSIHGEEHLYLNELVCLCSTCHQTHHRKNK